MSKIKYSQNLAKLKSYAQRGDEEAAIISAMLDGIKVLDLTVGVEAANVINVVGQVTDMDGSPIAAVTNILVKSVPIAGAGTMAIGTDGVAKAGSASTEMWFQTTATGAFDIDVTNVVAEDNLLVFQQDDGEVEAVVLTFA